jgi:hypothetical protein
MPLQVPAPSALGAHRPASGGADEAAGGVLVPVILSPGSTVCGSAPQHELAASSPVTPGCREVSAWRLPQAAFLPSRGWLHAPFFSGSGLRAAASPHLRASPKGLLPNHTHPGARGCCHADDALRPTTPPLRTALCRL